MLESLEDLRCNKKRIIKGDSDILLSWRKVISETLKQKKSPKIFDPLKISLLESLDDPNKSKWRLAGYGTHQPVEFSEDIDQKAINLSKISKEEKSIATILRINTVTRRKILEAISDSSDILDAMARLSSCIKVQKERREIPPIILLCAKKEKEYNPFYALLASTLIQRVDGVDATITYMYALWDFARSLDGKIPIQNINNLALFYADLICRGSLSLSAFKVQFLN